MLTGHSLTERKGHRTMAVNDLCINCFARKGKTPQCQRCGYVDGTPRVAPYLAPGTVLAERFVVGKHEKVTGEGVTYLGYDAKNNERVVIREYLPLTLCSRPASQDDVVINEGCQLTYEDYRQDFLDIAKAVSRLSDIDIFTPVRAIFECNNTAYAVYDKPDGRPLGDIVKKAQRLTWDEARPLFLPLISAMNSAHAVGLVHFGISPDTIYFSRDKKLHVTGFAIPDSRMSDTSLKSELFEGYSAIEQYSTSGKRGKATDVYGLCALLFFTLTGKHPPEAVTRAYEPKLNMPAELADEIPSHVFAALASGLQVMSENRIQSMDELRSLLSVKSSPAGARPVAAAASAAGAVVYGRTAREARPAPERQRPANSGAVYPTGVSFQQRINESAVGRAIGDLGNKVSNKISAFGNLKQWQYLLLSLVISMVVLGIIAIIVLTIFRPFLERSDVSKIAPPEEYIMAVQSETDVKAMYDVPDLVGKKWTDVEKSKDQYYYFEIFALAEEEASDKYDEGEIVRQTPEAGVQAEDGTVIQVVISSGSSTVKIPKIKGKSVYEAQQMLDELGLRLGEQVTEYSDEYEFGKIIDIVNNKVGDKVGIGSYINVKVSAGPEPTTQIIEDE